METKKTKSPKRIRKPINLTLPDDVRGELEKRSEAFGISKSAILTGLARVYCGLPLQETDKPVEVHLKRVLGRAQFLAFLDAVETVLTSSRASCSAIGKQDGDKRPEAWLVGGVPFLAFYSVCDENAGDMFKRAVALKQSAAGRVVVVSTTHERLGPTMRATFSAAGIDLVNLADLRAELGKLPSKKPRR